MSSFVMARPICKTYSRTVRKVDPASQAFDDAVLGGSGKPCAVKATSIIQKWGKASFTSTRNAVAAESARSRKRKIEEDKDTASDDDPFSFDLEDVGPTRAKRGMGFKIPEKSPTNVGVTEKSENIEVNVKTLRENKNKVSDNIDSKLNRNDMGDGFDVGNVKLSSVDNRPTETNRKKQPDALLASCEPVSEVAVDGNGAGSKRIRKPSQKKQLLMDSFTNKSQGKSNVRSSTNQSKQTNVAASTVDNRSPKRVARKFFASREPSAENVKRDTTNAVSTRLLELEECISPIKSDDIWGDDTGWDMESGDPEIIFNSSRKSGECKPVGAVSSSETARVRDALPCVVESNALSEPEMTSEVGKKLKEKRTLDFLQETDEFTLPSSAEREKPKPADVPAVKRLLTTSQKGRLKKKASYNHRQWQNPADEIVPDSGSSQTSAVEPSKPKKDEMDFESSEDEQPIKSPPVMYRSIGKPLSQQRTGELGAGIKVSKKHKQLFMVVRNVKRAHECQEHGETQEFTDDIDYILDGLHAGQTLSMRCLSAVNLLNKCVSHSFRMHLRAHGILAKIFTTLQDAAKNPMLALCTSAVMYMMSRDRLTFELDESSLELVLQVLEAETPGTSSDPGLLKEYESIQKKIHSLVDGFIQNGKVQHGSLLVSDVTAGHLAMESLLRLTSKRDGDWFKDELRKLGGLDHIVNTACKSVGSIDDAALELCESTIDALTRVDRCFRVLENVTYLKPENQNHLICYNSSMLIGALVSCLKFCEECLPFNELTTKGDKVDKECPGYVVYSCLLAALRVLVNMTHDNEVGCSKVGLQENLIKTVLTCILRLPRYLPAAERFDVLVLGLGLLVNLVENSRGNLRLLLNTRTVAPFDQYPSISGSLNSLEALGMLFSLRYEAAKMIEEEHDAEMEEKERQRQDLASKCSLRNQLDNNESGMWQESDSGIQWIAVTKDSKAKDSVSGVSDDASSVGDFQMLSQTSSQGEMENFTKALHKAGRHMEDSIVAAYVALLVGCVIQHNMDLAEKVRDTLPDCSFDPMIRMLRKFLGFMNLTSSSAANSSKSILRVLEVLESC